MIVIIIRSLGLSLMFTDAYRPNCQRHRLLQNAISTDYCKISNTYTVSQRPGLLVILSEVDGELQTITHVFVDYTHKPIGLLFVTLTTSVNHLNQRVFLSQI